MLRDLLEAVAEADDELIEFMCENEKDYSHMVGK